MLASTWLEQQKVGREYSLVYIVLFICCQMEVLACMYQGQQKVGGEYSLVCLLTDRSVSLCVV